MNNKKHSESTEALREREHHSMLDNVQEDDLSNAPLMLFIYWNQAGFRTRRRLGRQSAGPCSESGASGGVLAGWGGGGRGEKRKEAPGASETKKGQAWDLAKTAEQPEEGSSIISFSFL
ncbi:hypothetical protein LDENG_00084590 [Lucifuga dentata]|nr:hypothetical protein LDENG_00084590 [Lucifuga dentata]